MTNPDWLCWGVAGSHQTGGGYWLSLPTCSPGCGIPASHTGPFMLQERLEGNHSAMSSRLLLLGRFLSISLRRSRDPRKTPNLSSQLTEATQAWRYWDANAVVELQLQRAISLSAATKLHPWCILSDLAQSKPRLASGWIRSQPGYWERWVGATSSGCHPGERERWPRLLGGQVSPVCLREDFVPVCQSVCGALLGSSQPWSSWRDFSQPDQLFHPRLSVTLG